MCTYDICAFDTGTGKVPNAVVNERMKLPDMPSLIADRQIFFNDVYKTSTSVELLVINFLHYMS